MVRRLLKFPRRKRRDEDDPYESSESYDDDDDDDVDDDDDDDVDEDDDDDDDEDYGDENDLLSVTASVATSAASVAESAFSCFTLGFHQFFVEATQLKEDLFFQADDFVLPPRPVRSKQRDRLRRKYAGSRTSSTESLQASTCSKSSKTRRNRASQALMKIISHKKNRRNKKQLHRNKSQKMPKSILKTPSIGSNSSYIRNRSANSLSTNITNASNKNQQQQQHEQQERRRRDEDERVGPPNKNSVGNNESREDMESFATSDLDLSAQKVAFSAPSSEGNADSKKALKKLTPKVFTETRDGEDETRRESSPSSFDSVCLDRLDVDGTIEIMGVFPRSG